MLLPNRMTRNGSLLLDIGNTNTHLGWADASGIVTQKNVPTASWFTPGGRATLKRFIGRRQPLAVALCSVVPKAVAPVKRLLRDEYDIPVLQLTAATVSGIGIDYPAPETIGADRLANAMAVNHLFGAPAVVVDFGTAVTFDIVNRQGNYVGGIIAPGLAAMTEYLHEKTALLPRIEIREVHGAIGKNTEEAMLIGAVHGYRGLIRELLREIREELRARKLPVIATGGYAELMARGLPEITRVEPLLTLEGLRLALQGDEPEKVKYP